jgi:hypothetical protein
MNTQRSRGGRPRTRPSGERMNEILTLHVEPQQLHGLRELATQRQTSVSELVRRAIDRELAAR